MSKSKKTPGSLVWFEVPANNTARATKFYGKLFNWKINPLPHVPEYFHLDTGGKDGTPDGAVMKRTCPEHPLTIYISVASVTAAATKIKKLGGRVVKPKTAVPGMGYFAICQDPEKNAFAIWELNPKAK
jgi:uncharacterized protein